MSAPCLRNGSMKSLASKALEGSWVFPWVMGSMGGDVITPQGFSIRFLEVKFPNRTVQRDIRPKRIGRFSTCEDFISVRLVSGQQAWLTSFHKDRVVGSCVTLLEGYPNHWQLIRCLVAHRTLSSRSSHHLQIYRFTHDAILPLLLLLCSLSSWFSRYMDPSTTISRNYFVTPIFENP